METETLTAPAKARFSAVDVALVVMSFVWGLNFTAVKGALADFQPLTFNAIRFGTSSLFLLGVLWLRERSIGVHRKDLARFIMLAIIGNTAYQLFFINGIALTTATNSALILATTPIFIILFGALLKVEKITSRVVQGVILSFLGVVMIVLGSGNTLSFSDQSLLGDLLIVANPICWSIYTVLSKPMLKEYSPLKLTTVTMAIGAVPLVLVAIPSLSQKNWSAISASSWLGLSFSAFLAIGLGYVIWYTGVSRIGSARTSLYDNLVTVFAVAAAWILLGENMTVIQIVGAVLVFVSLYAVRRKTRSKTSQPNV
ncbi:MAG TPA: DMT family transporter [Candidatus Bathyarchaeia archaeon]|nr:DMT family transporter [Candidatus Bathyarchaeia archaeon]